MFDSFDDDDGVIHHQANGQDGNGYGVYAQLYNAIGVAVGSEFQVNQATSNDQTTPTVAMAKALRAYGQPVITDDKGTPHDWRVEMIAKLASLQKPEGGWSGDHRWMEDNPVLATSYSVLALEEVVQDLKEHPAK